MMPEVALALGVFIIGVIALTILTMWLFEMFTGAKFVRGICETTIKILYGSTVGSEGSIGGLGEQMALTSCYLVPY